MPEIWLALSQVSLKLCEDHPDNRPRLIWAWIAFQLSAKFEAVNFENSEAFLEEIEDCRTKMKKSDVGLKVKVEMNL